MDRVNLLGERLAGFALLIYLLFPTQNYYWDGILFAQHIEDAAELGPSLLHPNHLLYNYLGLAAYRLANLFHPVRALYVLQAVNSLLGACAVLLVFRILGRIRVSRYTQVCLTILFAFSATWWRFATDADAYIASILLLLISFEALLGDSTTKYGKCALAHGGAALIHQLAIFFLPVIAVSIWIEGKNRGTKWRNKQLSLYLILFCAITAGAYLTAYSLLAKSGQIASFPEWVTSHSADSSFSFGIVANTLATLKSYGRLFAGGRPSLLAGQLLSPQFLFSTLLISVVALLFVRWMNAERFHNDQTSNPSLITTKTCTLVWLIVYGVFLFFWLPGNTFYKLFVLPAILFGATLTTRVQARWLAPCIALLTWINFTFAIYPYSRVGSELVQFSHLAGRTLPRNTVVLFKDFIPDDWYIRYFTPQTQWKQIASTADASEICKEARARGDSVWIENTAQQYLRATRFLSLLRDQNGNVKLWRLE